MPQALQGDHIRHAGSPVSQACSVCGAGTSGTVLCRKHADITRQDLRSLPAHALDLHTMLQRLTRTGTPNDGGKAADPALTWQRIGDQFLTDVDAYLKANALSRPYAKPAGCWCVGHGMRGPTNPQ